MLPTLCSAALSLYKGRARLLPGRARPARSLVERSCPARPSAGAQERPVVVVGEVEPEGGGDGTQGCERVHGRPPGGLLAPRAEQVEADEARHERNEGAQREGAVNDVE